MSKIFSSKFVAILSWCLLNIICTFLSSGIMSVELSRCRNEVSSTVTNRVGNMCFCTSIWAKWPRRRSRLPNSRKQRLYRRRRVRRKNPIQWKFQSRRKSHKETKLWSFVSIIAQSPLSRTIFSVLFLWTRFLSLVWNTQKNHGNRSIIERGTIQSPSSLQWGSLLWCSATTYFHGEGGHLFESGEYSHFYRIGCESISRPTSIVCAVESRT